MKINIREKDGVVILDLEGNIDINASDFIETAGWVVLNKSRDVLCNFENVQFIDYVGISLIAVVYKNILNHKGRMKLYKVPLHVQKLFTVVGMDRVFDYHDTEEEAITSFKQEENFTEILKKQLRRRFKRIPITAPIEFKQKDSNQEFRKGKVLNLSAIGVFLITDHILPIDQILTIRLPLLPKPGVIEAEAKIVWVADEQIQPLESPAMGLEFHNIEPEKQEQIVEFVERHLTHSSQE